MTQAKISESYINELCSAVSALHNDPSARIVRIDLDDAARTVEVAYSRNGSRVRGRVTSALERTDFELRIRPRHVEYRYLAVGRLRTITCTRDDEETSQEAVDKATLLAKVAFRLPHLSVLQRVRAELRQRYRRAG